MKAIVAKNIKIFRDANNFTQEQVANFLGIERGTFSNYELGSREIPVELLVQLSHLYGIELSDFFIEEEDKLEKSLICSFRMENLSDADLKAVSSFKDIVKNYLKMCTLEK